MNLIVGIMRQLLALFVDDGSLAVAILIVVTLAAIATSAFELSPAVAGGILIIGCILMLLENVLRAARRSSMTLREDAAFRPDRAENVR
jgi:hypothetical protein